MELILPIKKKNDLYFIRFLNRFSFKKTCILSNFCIIGTEVFSFSMQKNAFTLVELMIVITIIAILSLLSYAPYNYYSNISRVRFSAQKIEQAVNEGRVSSIGWYSLSGTNVHIWLVFPAGSNTFEMRGYDISAGTGAAMAGNGELIRTTKLEDNVLIQWTNTFILFEAPTGKKWPTDEQRIQIAFKNADSGSALWKEIVIKND